MVFAVDFGLGDFGFNSLRDPIHIVSRLCHRRGGDNCCEKCSGSKDDFAERKHDIG